MVVAPVGVTTIRVKIPARILRQIPAAGHARNGFVIKAIEEKIARRNPVDWKPTTKRGQRMADLLQKGRAERTPLLSVEQVEAELRERRGRRF